jgi:hypothetical protein
MTTRMRLYPPIVYDVLFDAEAHFTSTGHSFYIFSNTVFSLTYFYSFINDDYDGVNMVPILICFHTRMQPPS